MEICRGLRKYGECYSSIQIRGGEQVSFVQSSGIRFRTTEKLIHQKGVLFRTQIGKAALTTTYVATHSTDFRPECVQVMSEIWHLPRPWSAVTFLIWPQLIFFFLSLFKQFFKFPCEIWRSRPTPESNKDKSGPPSYISRLHFHGYAQKQGYFRNIFPHFTSPPARLLRLLQAVSTSFSV